MDETPVDPVTGAPRRPVSRFGPDRRLTAATAAGAVTAALVGVLAADAAGRLLLVAAALVLAAYAATDLVFSPRLVLSADEVVVRTPLRRVHLAWADVERIGVDVRQRLGLRSVALEVDAGEVLVVLTRRALGADPEAVADLAAAFDPRHRPPRH